MTKPFVVNNQYLILEKIGVGGAATVYRAWDNMLQKFVAVKQIHNELSSDAKYVDMFRREAVNTAKLEQENIVRVVNFVRDTDGSLYIVMDYINGIDCEYLIEKCNKNSLSIPVDVALYITSEVLKALDYAHTICDEMTDEPLNIIHRDISPGNVLIAFSGKIKLTDFGIAKAGEEHNKQQDSKKLAGKIAYMSPEQAESKLPLDNRSDLFSTGLIMYELLTGQKAFTGDTDLDVWQKVKNANLDYKLLKEKNVPSEVIAILKKCLQKSRDSRYQSAAEMYLSIKQWLSKIDKTEGLKKRFKQYMRDVLASEINQLNKKKEQDQNTDFKTLFLQVVKDQPAPAAAAPAPVQPSSQVRSEDQGGSRASIEDHDEHHGTASFLQNKLYILIFAISAIMLLFIADISFNITPVGAGIHSVFWKPALMIDSNPSNARIEILKNGTDILSSKHDNTTPMFIKKIRSGVYTLKLTHESYGETVRQLTVFGKKRGTQSISIPGSDLIDGIHVVPFEVEIEVISEPSEADLFIDGNKVGKTPYKGTVYLGTRSFVIMKQGYKPIGSKNPESGYSETICSIDLSLPVDKQSLVDYGCWDLQEVPGTSVKKKLVLIAQLEKQEK